MSEDKEKPDNPGLRLVGGHSGSTEPAQLDEGLVSLVESLPEEQLKLLNEIVCTRLNYLQTLKDTRSMARFTPGDTVTFRDKQGFLQTGTVMKLNKKTVSVLNEDGRKWNVSPTYLERVVPLPKPESDTSVVTSSTNHQLNEHSIWHWTASRVPFPGAIDSDDGLYVPEIVIWMDGEQFIRKFEVLGTDDGPHSNKQAESKQILRSFENAIDYPPDCEPGVPEIVRTDRKDFIHLLAPLYPDIKFIHGEVPEIQMMANEMADAFAGIEQENEVIPFDDSPDPGAFKEIVSAFYDASAKLFKCAPWKHIATDTQLIGLSIESLQIQDQVISVIGQSEQSFGFVLHTSEAEFDRYLRLATSGDPSKFIDIAPHRALNFIPAKEIAPSQRKQTMEHGWKVANANAHPEILVVAGKGISRSPNQTDFEDFLIISSALVELFRKNKKINKCWKSDKQLTWSTSVKSTKGQVEVIFKLPALPPGKDFGSLNLLEQMSLLDKTDFDDAELRHHKLIDAISEAYRGSQEAQSVAAPGAGHTLLMDLSFNYHGYTIASMTSRGLEDILYEVIPRKVMMEATEADVLIEDCHSFLKFLKRVYHFDGADTLIASLGKKAVQRLQHALSDSSKFGLGKSIFSGKGTPFPDLTIDSDTDLDTLKEQMQQHMDSNDFDLPSPLMSDPYLDPPPNPVQGLSSTEKKKRKQKRKNSRKSRQRNR